MMARTRANGEGSVFAYRTGYAAYVWVTTPAGLRKRKWVYGRTREDVHAKWVELHGAARRGPLATKVPTVGEYVAYWLREVVRPDLRPKTAETYAMHARLYVVPGLGSKRLDRLTVRDVRGWLNTLADTCQCCAQGKDAARPADRQRCCALGECCGQVLSARTLQDIRAVLRAALTHAVTEEIISKNVAALVKLPAPRRRRAYAPWSVDEARRFLVSAQVDGDPFYAAYVLILVVGLRRGEVLALRWSRVDLEVGALAVDQGLQRISGNLVMGETKTDASEAVLPLPEICMAALRLRAAAQAEDRSRSAGAWLDNGLVFTTRYGTPIEPRNLLRSFDRRCARAGVRKIRLHDTRHTCGSLLAALDVHPRVAMQILRHSKIAVTMEIYTHIPSDLTRSALKKLGASLLGGEPRP